MDLSGDRSRLDFFLCKQPQPQLKSESMDHAAVKAEEEDLPPIEEPQAECNSPDDPESSGEAEEGSPPETACFSKAGAQDSGDVVTAASREAEATACCQKERESSQDEAECPEAGVSDADLTAIDVTQQQRMLRYFQAERKRQQEGAAQGHVGKRRATLACFFAKAVSRPS